MSARLVPVPETVHVAFAVLTSEPLDRQDLVPLPERSLLRLRGSSVQDLRRMNDLSYCRLVARSISAGPVLPALEAARAEAFELLGERDGLVVDLQIPRILTRDDVGSWAASRYFVFDYTESSTGVRTHGLEALGMPEVVIPDVDVEVRTHYDMVVVGLVHRLFQEWPVNDPVGPAVISMHDIAAGYEGSGDEAPSNDGPLTHVLIDYLPDEHVLQVELMDNPHDPRN